MSNHSDLSYFDLLPGEQLEPAEVSPAAVRFADTGLNDLAYVKQAVVDGQLVWAVHAADGTPLTTLVTREIAFATVRQHALEPVSVH